MSEPASIQLSRRAVLLLSAAAAGVAAPAGWNDADLLEPKALAARLAQPGGTKPVMLHVGFHVLYRSKHIPDSIYAGPGNKPEGLERIRQAVAALPRDREIVLYCGCCPWVHCPNMKPALALLKSLGYRKVKAVMMETNFSKDWVQPGYPVATGA
ncbi:MAG: rhodanese-like domain-containing protein [Acidobacteria bacterium]|nr:rhodanese-like domain-containing protein [Acidobacteriota bacterium]